MYGSRPDEWFGLSVVGFKVFHDSGDEGANALESAAANPLISDFSEPAFHQVQPRSRGRSEVHVKTPVFVQPAGDLGVGMSAVVVNDKVEV